ncbi:Bifunctional epoxide hydrolase 2 [Aphelenchoides bicaudatus]|nr:Bifunctional epoxide hydrolase 2 [Aphelenchoides bicaudatus]
MIIFQIYEFLAEEAQRLKKQILPIPFQAVIFDLGTVYKFKDKELADSIARIASSSDTTLGRQLQEFELGKISFEQLKSSVEQRVNSQTPPDTPVNDVIKLTKDDHLLTAVDHLRRAGYKTALLTNIGFKDDSRLQTIVPVPVELKTYFDLIIESCRVQLRKPNPRIYELTARRLGLEPQECIYVDELPRHCRGAEVVGMKSIQVAVTDSKRAIDQLSHIFGIDLY